MHLRSVTLHAGGFPDRERYPFHLPFLQRLGRLEFEAPVTFFVGENGSGKTTLLEAIARRCGIHLWREEGRPRVAHNRWEDRLCEHVEVEWSSGAVPGSFFGADIFRTFTLLLDEWAAADPGLLRHFGGQSLMTMSHGQSLMAFFRSRFALRGLYLLDEPEAALSPRTQLALRAVLEEAGAGGRAQFVVSSHSPLLMSCRGAALWHFADAGLRRVRLEETEHYRVWREFVAAREAVPACRASAGEAGR